VKLVKKIRGHALQVPSSGHKEIDSQINELNTLEKTRAQSSLI
jgi:hypothetical protein